MHHCAGLHWVHAESQGIPVFPCTLGYGDSLKGMAQPLHLSYLSGFYIMPADMLSEFFFTRLKCHFIYGYWIEQSFICSWLHLFVAWLKWMLLQVYVKNHLSLWAGIWKKAAKCTLQYYFSFFDVLLQHQIQFSIFFSKIEKVSFLYHCIFILLHG